MCVPIKVESCKLVMLLGIGYRDKHTHVVDTLVQRSIVPACHNISKHILHSYISHMSKINLFYVAAEGENLPDIKG